VYQTVVYSAPKKSGKTETAAMLTLYWANFLCKSYGEIYCCANDLEQAQSRVFTAVVKAVEANPNISAHITQRLIVFPNGTKIIALASDYKGAAGANQDLAVFDELWAFSSESSRRLYEEMTPVPTKESTRLVVTYAGFLNESALLHELYQTGMSGERIFEDLPCYRNGRIFTYWDVSARMPWQTAEYYEEQRKILRPNQFKRLHENAWVAAESQFIAIETWDACVNSELSPAMPGKEIYICVGVDASVKRDFTAVVAVTKLNDDTIRLVHHRLWKPLKGEINFADVEAYILWLHQNFYVSIVRFDPFQFASSAQRLSAKGVRLEEYPQTTTNLTEAGSLLYELIDSQRLEVYPDADFRQQIQNVVAVETTRGFRLSKEESGRKIDLIAALSFACVAALTLPNQASLVYRDYWNEDIHVVKDFSVPMDWQKYRALDFGVENPFVCLFVAKSEEDEFFVYDEIYQSGKTSSEWAEILRARENERYEIFEFTVADPSAKDQIRTFCSHDVLTIGCWNSDVGFGIEQVKKLLKKHPRRGTPKLRVMARCTHVIREFNHYSVQRMGDRNVDEKPVKLGDHTMEAIRYFAVEISRWMSEIVEMSL